MKILTQYMQCGLFDDDKYTIYAYAGETQGLAITEMLRNLPNVLYVSYFRYQGHLLQIDYIGWIPFRLS